MLEGQRREFAAVNRPGQTARASTFGKRLVELARAAPPPSARSASSLTMKAPSALLTIQRHTKTQQTKLPTAWPGFDCMGWEYDPLYDGLEWPPRHIGPA
jgi:hypothetical protein